MSSDDLWEKVKAATETARLKNAIFSIETKSEFVEEKGMKVSPFFLLFFFHLLSSSLHLFLLFVNFT
jgi:hypothetical protein